MCYENNYFCSSAIRQSSIFRTSSACARVVVIDGEKEKDQQFKLMMRETLDYLLSIQILTNTKNCCVFVVVYYCSRALDPTTRQLIIIIITIFIIGHYFVKK